MKSAYIHIPFCNNICSYCDFCKVFYNKKWINDYLNALELEIKTNYKGETLDTIYIGGGTPSSLDINELNKLFDILKIFKLNKTYEFTFECNIEDITIDKIKILKENKVNRLSIGVQSFNEKHIELLNRHHTKEEVFKKIELLKTNGFDNINIDLIYAIPNQTLKDLEEDLDNFLKLDIPHISTYSLIIEENTKLYIDGIENISEELDYEMYKLINKKLSNYHHYEISNFSKKGYESKHNLTYWNNDTYYGFGLGSTGYDGKYRYTNTRSINNYLNNNYILEKEEISFNEKIENAFILGFRKIDGINIKEFKNKYNIDINDIDIVNKLIQENKLIKDEENIKINEKYIYISNDILLEFLGGSY